MAESNKQPPLCPCGFWGSAQTSGLCSVCYKERQQQSKEHDSKLFVPPSNSSSAPVASSACQPASVSVASRNTSATHVKDEHLNVDDTATSSSLTDSASVSVEAKQPDGDGERIEDDSVGPSIAIASNSRDASPSQPIQKNKRRCFVCKARLELVLLEIGRCKCGYTFCELHRLPEQHNCTYDHKETARQEARDKMVSPKKHVGTSLRRLDSDS